MAACLVTGYESKQEFENSSGYLARAVDGLEITGGHVVGVVLSADTTKLEDELTSAITKHEPGVVLALGVSRRAIGLQVERVGINVRDFRFPDHYGKVCSGEPVIEGGPTAYFSTVPIKAMVKAIRDADVPARLSNSAGTHMCNQALYTLLHYIATHDRRGTRGGFVHVPSLPEYIARKREGGPSMSLDLMVRGLGAAINAASTTEHDIVAPMEEWEW